MTRALTQTQARELFTGQLATAMKRGDFGMFANLNEAQMRAAEILA